jgi:hypothetical protein
MARVFEHARATGTDRLVLVALAYFCNAKRGDNTAWPSLAVLAKRVKLTVSGLCKSLKRLEAIGDIKRDRSSGGRNQRSRYIICAGNCEPVDTVSVVENCEPEDSVSEELNSVLENSIPENSIPTGNETVSPSSHALNRNRTGKRETESDELIPDSQSFSTAKRKLTRPGQAATDPRVKPFLSWFAEEYQKRFGAPYATNWGKDGKRIKGLSPAFDVPKLKELAIQFFESDDSWIREKGGFTVGVFLSQINKLASTTNGNSNAQDTHWRKRTFINV